MIQLYIYMRSFFLTLFHYDLSQYIEYSSLCYPVGFCYSIFSFIRGGIVRLSTLLIAVRIKYVNICKMLVSILENICAK